MIIIEIFRKNGFILLLPDQTQFWNFLGKRLCFTKIGFANQPPNDGAKYKYTILSISLLSDMQIFVLLVIQLKLQFNHEKNISDIGI